MVRAKISMAKLLRPNLQDEWLVKLPPPARHHDMKLPPMAGSDWHVAKCMNIDGLPTPYMAEAKQNGRQREGGGTMVIRRHVH